MTYAEIEAWIEEKYTEGAYDFFNVDDIPQIRQRLVDEFDPKGSVAKFLDVIAGTNEERRIFENIEEPLIDETNIGLEESLGGEIETATTADDVADIEIPPTLMPEIVDRLEEAKNIRWGEIRGDEIREDIASPETELSEFKQISKDIGKLPDEAVQEDIRKEAKEERGRLVELGTTFLNELKEQTDEGGLDRIIGDIRASDLKERQKERLVGQAEIIRESGFPELI